MVDARTSSHSPKPGLVHEALIYHDEAEFDTAMHAFMQEAAAVGEPVLVALPGPHLDHVREMLDDAVAGTHCEDLERVARNPSCLLSMIEEWVASHDGRARVVSEVVWPGRPHAEAVEALRHEALVNHALARIGGATTATPSRVRALPRRQEILDGVEDDRHPTRSSRAGCCARGRRPPQTSALPSASFPASSMTRPVPSPSIRWTGACASCAGRSPRTRRSPH